MQRRWIIIEGIDNVGKSSIISLIKNKCLLMGIEMFDFQYPGKQENTLGKLIYDIHHKIVYIDNITPLCLKLLHIVAHINLLQQDIISAINNGKMVLLDRYWWSTIAYSKASNIDDEFISRVINIERKLTDIIICKMFFILREIIENMNLIWLKKKILKEYSRLFNECRDEKYEISNEGPIENISD